MGGCSPPNPPRDPPTAPRRGRLAKSEIAGRTDVLQCGVQTCTQCGETKEAEAFGFKNAAIGKRHRKCNVCVAEYGRAHYERNRVAYIARAGRANRERRRLLQRRIWEYLAEHPCVDCGETDPLVLEFDHIDPAHKRTEMYYLVHRTYRWATIQAEIERCEVRCVNCHRRRTAVQFAWAKHLSPDGTNPRPKRARLDRPERRQPTRRLASAVAGPMHRLCLWCQTAKGVEEFHFRDKARGVRQSICGECFTTYRREHYQLNREHYIRRNARVLRERGRKWMARLREYLRTNGCVECGEQDVVVLDLDHVEPASKRNAVSFIARSGYPWSTVMAEIAKCEVRCGNCHRRRTAAQFGWPKVQFAAGLNSSRNSGPGRI